MFGLAIVFIAVVGICAGQGYQKPTSGYGTQSYAARSGRNNYRNSFRKRNRGYEYGYNYNNILRRNLDGQLEKIDIYSDNLEAREANQLYRLNRLTQSASRNLDFRNNFENTISEEIAFHQQQQNKRCDDLDQAIAQIRLIRERVLNLTVDAEAIRTNLEDEVFPVNKEIASDIRHLQHEDILRSNRITETQGRADAVNDGIDVLITKAWENTRFLYSFFRDIKAAINSLNRERVGDIEVTLDPHDASGSSATIYFQPPFDGTPQGTQAVITGFHLVRKPDYNYGYRSIYFGIDSMLWNNRGDITSVDMSSGGWKTEKLFVQGRHGYFDSNTLIMQTQCWS